MSSVPSDDDWAEEQQEWLDAIDDVLSSRGTEGARDLLTRLQHHLSHRGMVLTDVLQLMFKLAEASGNEYVLRQTYLQPPLFAMQ